METSCLGQRFGRHLVLSATEEAALRDIEATKRVFAPGAVLCAEQREACEMFVVESGWLFSSMLLDHGNRQILCVHLRGDLAGDAILPWRTSPFTIVAASEAIVAVVGKAAMIDLFTRHPRLALTTALIMQVERVALADRLAAVGRTPARSRVAALIVDSHRRLRDVGVDTGGGFVLPLTQEEIGDATGLTAVHVNRMMRRLTEDGLIARTGGRIRVLDEGRLATVGNHVDRYAAIDVNWLPAPRA